MLFWDHSSSKKWSVSWENYTEHLTIKTSPSDSDSRLLLIRLVAISCMRSTSEKRLIQHLQRDRELVSNEAVLHSEHTRVMEVCAWTPSGEVCSEHIVRWWLGSPVRGLQKRCQTRHHQMLLWFDLITLATMSLLTDFLVEATKPLKSQRPLVSCDTRSRREAWNCFTGQRTRLFFRAKKLSNIGLNPSLTLVKQAHVVVALISLKARSRYFISHLSALLFCYLCSLKVIWLAPSLTTHAGLLPV